MLANTVPIGQYLPQRTPIVCCEIVVSFVLFEAVLKVVQVGSKLRQREIKLLPVFVDLFCYLLTFNLFLPKPK